MEVPGAGRERECGVGDVRFQHSRDWELRSVGVRTQRRVRYTNKKTGGWNAGHVIVSNGIGNVVDDPPWRSRNKVDSKLVFRGHGSRGSLEVTLNPDGAVTNIDTCGLESRAW